MVNATEIRSDEMTGETSEEVRANIERFLDGHTRNGAVGRQQNMVMRPKPTRPATGDQPKGK